MAYYKIVLGLRAMNVLSAVEMTDFSAGEWLGDNGELSLIANDNLVCDDMCVVLSAENMKHAMIRAETLTGTYTNAIYNFVRALARFASPKSSTTSLKKDRLYSSECFVDGRKRENPTFALIGTPMGCNDNAEVL